MKEFIIAVTQHTAINTGDTKLRLYLLSYPA